MKFSPFVTRIVPRDQIPLVTLVIAMLITLTLGAMSVRVEQEAGHREFQRLAEEFKVDLSNQIQGYIGTIPTLKAFAVLERYPSDARLDQFISAISLTQRFPNLAFIFLADRVTLAERDAYITRVRQDLSVRPGGRPAFAIMPAGDRPEYMVIRHVSPDNPKTVGYDLYDPAQNYRADVDAAVASGRMIATGPLLLAADRQSPRTPNNTSIVVREAVYTGNMMPSTPTARARQLQGVVGFAFKTKQLVDRVNTGKIAAQLSIRIVDSAQSPGEVPIFETPTDQSAPPGAAVGDARLILEIPVANRRWLINFQDRVPPATFWRKPVPLLIFGSGIAISVMLWALMRALVTRTSLAEAAVKEALILVRGEQAALEEAQAIAAIGSFEWRAQEETLRWSAQMTVLYGCSAETFLRKPRRLLARVPENDRRILESAIVEVSRHNAALFCEHRLRRDNGEIMVLQLRSKWQYDADGQPHVLTGTAQDVTALRNHEAEITRLAFVDSLTGLPNRRQVIEKLSSLIVSAKRDDVFHALLFVDLDNFKIVNDTKGHAIGDQMLAMAARRLSSIACGDDLVARIGGDEFVILNMTQARSASDAVTLATRVAEQARAALSEPFILDGITHVAGASVGISIFPYANQQYIDIFREADTAMYRSKEAGRNRVTVFEKFMHEEIERSRAFELDLANAVQKQQLHVVVQSQFDQKRRECGAELLLRWTHPSGENITPDRFIPIAEETGLIVELGAFVFERGCALVLALDASGLNDTVSINVSPRQFRQPDFVEYVRNTITRLQVPADRLVFEVTEGLLIEDIAQTANRMHELRALGIKFSIDDFGTGYSSLAYLRDLPLYELKIDKAFIHAAHSNANDAAIVKLILGIAAELDLKVVAEGVETDQQFEFLVKNGCDAMQGFLLARPVRLDDWVRARTMSAGLPPPREPKEA